MADTDRDNLFGRLCAEVNDLIPLGLYCLDILEGSPGPITFATWAEAVKHKTEASSQKVRPLELTWLWEAVTTHPGVADALKDRLPETQDQWRKLPPRTVLAAGSTLGVFLKGLTFHGYGYPVWKPNPDARPDALVRLGGPLTMRPGKALRYECAPVEAEVAFSPEAPHYPETEAAAMRLNTEAVSVIEGEVIARVRSLNQAFHIVSLRLQPRRRSHGGSIYHHMAWRDGDQWIALDAIRKCAEAAAINGQ